MKKNSITEFELEEKDSKLRLKRGLSGVPAAAEEVSVPMNIPAQMPAMAMSPAMTVAPLAAPTGEINIKSPMIGTFYRSPSPEAASYVEVGTEVGPDTVV